MTTSKCIFIRTYEDDAERLGFALHSIRKFVANVDDVVVVCQPRATSVVSSVVARHPFARLRVCEPYSNDYIGQQISKLQASRFTDCELIYHVDSDCIFTKPVSLDHYLRDGLPILFYRTYDVLYRQFITCPWQEPTSRFMRRQVDYEFMCGMPLVYPRQLYSDLHQWFVSAHGFDYDGIEARLAYKSNFSEFNLLGAFSFYHERTYHTLSDDGGALFDFHMKQFVVGVDRVNRAIAPSEMAEIRAILR